MNALFLRQADEAFFGPAWHGPSVLPTLNKLKVAEAVAVSPFEGYTAWGVALHMAYWKHRGHLLLSKVGGSSVASPGRFFRSPSDWPALPDRADQDAWAADLAEIRAIHERFIETLKTFPEEMWAQAVRADGTTAAQVAFGVPAHDLYHTAQIRNMGIKKF